MSAEPFGTWLRRQVHRQDPVGDLARDFAEGGSRAYTKSGVRQDLINWNAGALAWDAFDAAVDEWTNA